MSDYTFRGNPITGPGAYVLLKSIKQVMEDAPNPTEQDIATLEVIVKDMLEKWSQALENEYADDVLESQNDPITI
jgi:hypothetical protein